MNIFKKIFMVSLIFSAITSFHQLQGAASSSENIITNTAEQSSTNPLFIFLDDSEEHVGAITSSFISAVIQEAGPIIVSARLIENIRTPKTRIAEDILTLKQISEDSFSKPAAKLSTTEEESRKNIVLSVLDFDAQVKAKGIIKEINPSLYLLLPNKYIQEKQLASQEIKAFVPQGPITLTERALGLKVNHMKTVEITDIQSLTAQEPSFAADYFISSLNDIFVSTKEYLNLDKESVIPNWAIYITGHGELGYSICYLSLDQFKEFLAFLEKIRTKVLVYASCYAAGTNENLIYKDSMAGVDHTYPFTIITSALTDAPIYTAGITVSWEEDKPNISTNYDFNCFVKNITGNETTAYRKALACLRSFDVQDIAQIRYPGLPWFSILDNQRVVSINSVLAKTRTTPLNIATFFAKKGEAIQPDGILLYTHNIPFELIVDTKMPEEIDEETQESMPEECYVPTFVSMIPGDALHHLKKISSTCNTSDAILSSFYIKALSPHKIFIIDEVTAPFSETTGNTLTNGSATSGTITDVILDITKESGKKYFVHNGQVYYAEGAIDEENPISLANEEQKEQYASLIRLYGQSSSQIPIAPRHILGHSSLQENAAQTFESQIMDSKKAEQAAVELLESMPNATALRIARIRAEECPSDDTICWFNFLTNIAKHRQIGNHKLLWLDTIDRGYLGYRDVIIEIAPKETRLYYKDSNGQNPKLIVTSSYTDYKNLSEDYVPTYAEKFAYFDTHGTLNQEPEGSERAVASKSIRQYLTPDAIAKIKAALERGPVSPGVVATLVNTATETSGTTPPLQNPITRSTPANMQTEEMSKSFNNLPTRENTGSIPKNFKEEVVDLIVEALNDAYQTKKYNPKLAQQLNDAYNKAIDISAQSRIQADADVVTWLSLAEMVLGSKENPIFLEPLYQTTLKANFMRTHFPAYNKLP